MFNSQKSIDFLNTTTASHLQNLKRQATNSKKLNHTSMVFELNNIANDRGFANWALLIKAFNNKHLDKTKTITFYDTLYSEELFSHVSKQHSGLVLIGGSSGTGKTTLIRRMTEYLIEHVPKRIVSICPRWDQPLVENLPKECQGILIERAMEGPNAMSDVQSFCSALRSNPDVIILSELIHPELIAAVHNALYCGYLIIADIPMFGMYNMSVYDHPDPCLEQIKRWAPDIEGLDETVVATVNIGATKVDINNSSYKRVYTCKLYNR